MTKPIDLNERRSEGIFKDIKEALVRFSCTYLVDYFPQIIKETSRDLQPQYDPIFGARFEERLTPEYHQMRRELGHPLWQLKCKGSAIRGFHFSERETNTINPVNGQLYLFPTRPSLFQEKEIARLVAYAPGWSKRSFVNNSRSGEFGRDPPRYVYCYEINPTPEIADTDLTVVRNLEYGLTRYEGIGVYAPSHLEWKVMDRKVIDLLSPEMSWTTNL